MTNKKLTLSATFAVIFSMLIISANAQNKKGTRKKELYFSWGYNKEWYTRSTIKIDQPSLGNHYSFKNIKGHDNPGWDDGIFNKPLQYLVQRKGVGRSITTIQEFKTRIGAN